MGLSDSWIILCNIVQLLLLLTGCIPSTYLIVDASESTTEYHTVNEFSVDRGGGFMKIRVASIEPPKEGEPLCTPPHNR